MAFPDKEQRAQCWNARDKFWECLDQQNIDGSTLDKNSPCYQFRQLYEKSCSLQWVKHFDRKRSYLKFKDNIEKKGYEPLDQRSAANK